MIKGFERSDNLEALVDKLESVKQEIKARLNIENVANNITNILMTDGGALADKVRKCLMLIMDFIDSEKASIMLVSTENKDELVVVEALRSGASNTNIIGFKQKISNTIASWVYKNKELLMVEDISKDPRFNFDDFKKFKINYKSNSLLSMPLVDKENRVVGVLNLTDKKDNGIFDKSDTDAVVIFADRITPTLVYSILNETLKKKNVELTDLNKIKTDLTNMVIHDIKGHVGEVISNVDLLKYSKDLAPNYKECVASAIEGCESLLRLVLNLLDISKMEDKRIRLKYVTFNISDLVKQVVQPAQVLAMKKNVKINVTGDDACLVSADKVLIERIIDNLLLNAISYSPEDGVIEISVMEDDDIKVRVKDEGQGVPKEFQEKIFDKYEQIDKNTAKYSTGLGLTFCKMAVEEHEGTICVKSEDGLGSEFTFSLPKLDEDD